MNETDLELLRRYCRDRAEDAFAEIVRRHLDLVHSAAFRQVRSPQLAEEVAQSAFTDLARNAHRLAPDTILTAWLYQVTRRTAIDVVRHEARRRLREQIASEMNAMTATDADWTHIEPLLDEAMHALNEIDRAAVLLRYFENKSLREVGQTLGTSEDAAQKRVSRAVERLRDFFGRRGVAVGASGLVVVISANAVQAAPVGMAVTISTAAALAGTTIATTATATATKAIAMTILQKTLITVTVVASVGTGIYKARQASTLRTQVQTLQQQQAPLVEQLQQLTLARDQAANQLAALRDENERLNRNTGELLSLHGEVGRLRQQTNELGKLREESRQLRSGLADRRNAPVGELPLTNSTSQASVPRESWVFAGCATPEATFQSLLWAMGKGDVETYLAILADQKQEVSPTEGTLLNNWLNNIQGYRITGVKPLPDGGVTLSASYDDVNHTQDEVTMRNIGGQWKVGRKERGCDTLTIDNTRQ
jgi:RNA polymerase sigma factor (sigma-70 family)